MHRLFSRVIFSIIYLISYLPLRVHYVYSRAFGWLLFSFFGYRNETIYINLSRAFPTINYERVEELTKKFRRNFTDIIAESIKNLTIPERKIREKITIENPQLLKSYWNEERSIIVVLGHIGNWELLASIGMFEGGERLGYHGSHFVFGYKGQNSKVADEIVNRVRKIRGGVSLVESDSLARSVLRSRGKKLCYFLIADQSPPTGSRFEVDFLNVKSGVLNGPEVLSRAADLPVLYLDMRREERGCYSIKFKEITSKPKEEVEGYITESYFKLLEESIIKEPDSWLWSHRRWKRDFID